VEVLRGVDLSIGQGEVLALVGANGAGKSTLCAVVAGLVEARAGTVRLAGRDVSAVPAHRRVRAGAFLVPEGRGIFPNLTVQENLQLWLSDPADVSAACARFPILADRSAQLAGALSGGEQQMLALAAAFVRPPAVLIADEPSLGLAPMIVKQVYEALSQIRDTGTAILLVEEKPRDVLAVADRIAFMQSGQVVWVSRTADVDEQLLVSSYLGIQRSLGTVAEV
jgi:ABC-type branched-subunit amino acid transport system ATPase component